MGKKNKGDDNAKAGKVKISRGGRSDKKIVDQFTRKFRNVIQSCGRDAAVDWLEQGPTRQVGRRSPDKRTIVLPMKKLWGILDKSYEIRIVQGTKHLV